MPKVAPFFDIFFKGESYARQAELIRECGFDCAETWRGIEADKLREAAVLRRDNPELTLSQLAALCDPPVSKSAFNHRLRKLMRLAGG